MKTIYDVRQLLKRYGVFIYTGNRLGDIELMEYEIRDLYKMKILSIQEYQLAILIIRNERSDLSK